MHLRRHHFSWVKQACAAGYGEEYTFPPPSSFSSVSLLFHQRFLSLSLFFPIFLTNFFCDSIEIKISLSLLSLSSLSCLLPVSPPLSLQQGSVKGIRYFNCQPKHGLFARAETVELAPTNPSAQQQQQPTTSAAPSISTATGNSHYEVPPQYGAAASSSRPGPTPAQVRFQIAASAFCFRKDTNQWSELGTGSVRLYGSPDGVVHLDSAGAQTALNHMIEMKTKLEPNIGSDRAWVFRAINIASGAGDVIALQFSGACVLDCFRYHQKM